MCSPRRSNCSGIIWSTATSTMSRGEGPAVAAGRASPASDGNARAAAERSVWSRSVDRARPQWPSQFGPEILNSGSARRFPEEEGPRERASIPMARRGRTPQGPPPQATPSAHRNPISLALRSVTGECNRPAFSHLGRREIVSSPRRPGRFANCNFVAIFLRSHGDTTRATQVRAWHAKPRAPRGQPGHRMSPPDQHRVRRPRSAAEPSRASPRMEGLLVGGNVPFLTCPPAWVRPRPVPGWPSPAEASSCVLRTPSDDPMRRSFVTQASKPCARSAALPAPWLPWAPIRSRREPRPERSTSAAPRPARTVRSRSAAPPAQLREP